MARALIVATLLVVAGGLLALSCGPKPVATPVPVSPTLAATPVATPPPTPRPTPLPTPLPTPVATPLLTPSPTPVPTPVPTPPPMPVATPAPTPTTTPAPTPVVTPTPAPMPTGTPPALKANAPPHLFYGRLLFYQKEDRSDAYTAPPGVVISAVVGGAVWETKGAAGGQGFDYSIQVRARESPGKAIDFYVGGIKADQSGIFQEAAVSRIDLTVRLR